MPDTPAGGGNLWIIGPGRLGLALGLALVRAGGFSSVTVSGRGATLPDHPLFEGGRPAARYQTGLTPPPPVDLVLIAVPDAAIEAVAGQLALAMRPDARPTVLHTSGALGSEVLAAVRARGCPAGSLHPLVAVSDPVAGADALRGATFAVEGDPEARSAAEALVFALDGRALAIDAGGKPLYHAAAVFASNYLVTLLGVAERLAGEAGVPTEDARAALVELARSALDGVAEKGPVGALTGPISRGDAGTIALHLARLSPSDAALYSVLARQALELARTRGLDSQAIARIGHLLPEID